MLTDIFYRLRAVFGRGRMEIELDDELRFHLDRQIERLRQAGHSSDEALRLARMALGGVDQTKEACRDSRGIGFIETTLQDIRFGCRMLRKSPGFTGAVALSLALGIGANTAIFTLVNAVLWRELPVRDPEELVLVGRAGEGWTDYGFTFREYTSLREPTRPFLDLAGYSPVPINVSVDGSMEPASPGQLVTGDYFRVLGVRPITGRAIGPEDDRVPEGHPVAMLSHRYWKRRFASDPTTVGRTITLSGRNFMIIGVTPPEFFGTVVGSNPDIFVPAMMQPVVMPAAENRVAGDPINQDSWVRTIARLRPGINLAEARARFAALAPVVNVGENAGSNDRMILTGASRGISDLRAQFSKPLFVLMTIVGVVLLIACANTATLLLSRAAARRPEFAIRLAIGAGRGRLLRQLLVESVLLAGLGGMLGILLARWATELLVAFLSAGRAPITLNLSPDVRVLGFTAAVSLLTGILFGIAPALGAVRVDIGHGRRTGVRHALRPGKVMAVLQVALSVVLLSGAGLFVRSLQKLNAQDAGFDRDSVLIVRMELRGSDQRGIPGATARLDQTYKDLIRRVAVLPGVRSASMAHFRPTTPVAYTEKARLASGEEREIPRLMIYSNYFSTMGIPVVAGRDFGPADLEPHSPAVAIVNEAFAKKILKGANPIAQVFQTRVPREYATNPSRIATCEIIGVVKDSRYASLRGETPPIIYQPYFQVNTGRGQMTLHVRVAGPLSTVLPRIREEVQKTDRSVPMFELRTLALEMEAALVQERLIALLSTAFGAVALILVCVGLQGLLAFAAVQRMAEVGIRMALGAQRRDVVWMILREGMLLAGIGVAIGVPVALLTARFAASRISGLLFGLNTTDPAAIIAAVAALLAIGGLAGYPPARRASRADPMTALRNI